MVVLQAYQSDLLNELDCSMGLNSDTIFELCRATGLILPKDLFGKAQSTVVNSHQEVKRQVELFREFIPHHIEQPWTSSRDTKPHLACSEHKEELVLQPKLLLHQSLKETGQQALNCALNTFKFKMLMLKLIIC